MQPAKAAKATFEAMHSRPSTSGGLHTRAPSPEYYDDEEEYDSDEEHQFYSSQSQGRTPPYNENKDEGASSQSTQSASSRRGSRTSPAADSAAHNNEIPQEYRPEVERIFFDFLNKICSNRECREKIACPPWLLSVS